MTLEIMQADAFTSRPFAGNPAAVCILPKPRDNTWMQLVARERNTSGTAFLTADSSTVDSSTTGSLIAEPGKGNNGWRIRFFTPSVEVELSGHTTLSAAHMLWETKIAAAAAPINFSSPAGGLTATRNGKWIELDFPALPAKQAAPPPELLEGLGLAPIYVGRNAYDYLVVVDEEAAVRELAPDFATLARAETRGVMVTARGDGKPYDFISRFFCSSRRTERGPGHRIGALLPGAILGGAVGKEGTAGLPGFPTRRRDARDPAGGSRAACRAGRDYAQGEAGGIARPGHCCFTSEAMASEAIAREATARAPFARSPNAE